MGDVYFKCKRCKKEFANRNVCPYCGSKDIELIGWIMS